MALSLLLLLLLLSAAHPLSAWDPDLELLDLVEEIQQNFYSFLSVEQDASPVEIKKAYRRLSLTLHPDKNKDENAETQFRQDELLSKKKKEKKKKLGARPAEEPRCIGPDRSDRVSERPHWQDILPLKLSIWLYLSIKHLPQTVQELRQFYEDYQHLRQQQREEAEAEQEVAPRERRPKVKKPKQEFPVYLQEEPTPPRYEEAASIEDIEEQMDDWLQEQKTERRKAAGWAQHELSLLGRLMVKFPGGSPGRWEKIAQELGRSVTEVTAKVKQVKDNVSQTSGLVKLSDLKAPPLPCRSFPVPEAEEEEAVPAVRRRNRKSAEGGEGGKIRGRRQRDFDPAAEEEQPQESGEGADPQERLGPLEPYEKVGPQEKGEPGVWTQNQQKLLELALQQFPRGTVERWDRIAKVVPGRSKEECMVRYKMLAELVQKRKQAKS
ncbi:dnaJ homolog subfamily C member 1 isoform X2 [Eleginops maclovinus]|uniref:dnaJ homolog subfamily C member 1 isoform X2 n=1 Tax=Eleginops maclovinus TaxID=56733 RepID=UPI003080DE49